MKRFFSAFVFLLLGFSSLQSQSYTKSDIIIYISKYKNSAIKKSNEYKIPASITLAQGILESGAGTSELAINANNHFGIKCGGSWYGETYTKDDDEKDDCFRKYATIENCYDDHSLFLVENKRYASLFNNSSDDYISWAKGLQDAGYATNPEYSKILVRIIEEYQLYNYDKPSPKTAPLTASTTVAEVDNAVTIQEIIFRPTEKHNERDVYTNNHTRFVIAKANDSFLTIANDFFSRESYIRKYNDVSKDAKLKEGDIVYIETKRNKGDRDFHLVAQGETLWQISQDYAMKLKSLAKLNGLEPSVDPRIGENLCLKKKRPKSSKPSY